MAAPVGILGLGTYLPPQVRRNDFWSPDLVGRWMSERRARAPIPPVPTGSPGARQVIEAMGQQAEDPFQGAVERRVIPDGMSVFEMEERAARMAIANAGIDPQQIDLLLTYTIVPEVQLGNPACTLHHRLGLSSRCFAMHTDVATYAFPMQLQLAEAMIRSGRARYALLVQSSAASRVIDMNDPGSALFGDGAAATVVGPIERGEGFIDAVHFADGSVPKTLVASVPGKAWHEDGRVVIHVADRAQMLDVFTRTADVCKTAVDAVLEQSGRSRNSIDFLCVYQGTPWLRTVVQRYIGLEHARSCDTFRRFAYLSAAMIPVNLWVAQEEGALREGDLVVITGGGTGMTYGATLLRWCAS